MLILKVINLTWISRRLTFLLTHFYLRELIKTKQQLIVILTFIKHIKGINILKLIKQVNLIKTT